MTDTSTKTFDPTAVNTDCEARMWLWRLNWHDPDEWYPVSTIARMHLLLGANIYQIKRLGSDAVHQCGGTTTYTAALAFYADMSSSFRPTHTHLKSGAPYQTLDVVTDATNASNGRKLVLYRSVSGRHFVRLQEEFNDGRFEHIGKRDRVP